jgi:hypothetical protein
VNDTSMTTRARDSHRTVRADSPSTASLDVHRARLASAGGFSLIETMVGMSILLVVAVGVLPLGVLALRMTENEGHLIARCGEYAQDKLEQLMALPYGDTLTDTRVFPATPTQGSGLSPGGSADPAAPVALYADYLNESGELLDSPDGAPPAGWFYQRVWRVEEVGAADSACPVTASAAQICLKRITVIATVRAPSSGGPVVPRVTVTALKTFPF